MEVARQHNAASGHPVYGVAAWAAVVEIVKAPDLCCLVRKTIPDSERSSDDYFHQYFVETKSGTRHEIDPFFAEYDSNAGRIFGRIRERFPWVQIREERG